MLSYREAVPVIVQMEASAREVGVSLALDPGTAPPRCVFAPSERPRALYAAGLERWCAGPGASTSMPAGVAG
jgi:hypothetical protein